MKAKSSKEDHELPSIDEWIKEQAFETTADIEIPERLADQVIGQDEAVEVMKKAADQKRHVMLIGDPGTGKSMLAKSMTDFLPKGELQDVIVYNNLEDANEPKIRIIPAGTGKDIVGARKKEAMQKKMQKAQSMLMISFIIIGLSVVAFIVFKDPMIILFGIIAAIFLYMVMRMPARREEKAMIPKLLISHREDDEPPFIDATGAHAGALLGDVKHDPFQSGGLETPAHERVEAGAIHKAHKGVLFIDEINVLRLESQQSLLTALQEKEFSVIGQSERSSGAMVKSEAVPCDFILVVSGNLDAVKGMHPALRSRIRGYGYEIYMKSTINDTISNRQKLIRFVAQEVVKDKEMTYSNWRQTHREMNTYADWLKEVPSKIPHFSKVAVGEILREAQRRAGRRGQLTLRLRELSGLIKVAGDVAHEQNAKLVTSEHVLTAKKIARSLEQQVADRFIEKRKEYKTFATEGFTIGVVNGLAALGAESGMAEYSGIVLPIVAEVTPAQTKSGGKIIATGKLGEIAKEAVQNVLAIIKKYTGEDISNHDVHVQFIGTYEGVEGDSASISVATAVISALEDVEVDQSVGMTGSLSVRGQVLPVGAVTAKIEAACEMGLKKVLIPKANMRDVLLEDKYLDKIEVIPVENLKDVLTYALVGTKKEGLLKKLAALVPSKARTLERPAPHL